MDREEKGKQKQEGFSVARMLEERGVSRRDFLKFCSTVTAAMALPADHGAQGGSGLGQGSASSSGLA